MGTEIAVPFFGPLIAIGIAILLYLTVSGRKAAITGSSKLGLGRTRLALGYLGALIVVAIYCYVDTTDLSHTKVARGDVTPVEAAQNFWGWYLNIFCLMTPFVIFFLTAVGLPLLAVLRRFRFASVLAAMLCSQACAAFISLYSYNDYCDSHRLACFRFNFASNSILAGAVTAGFVLMARLPWLRSAPMPKQPKSRSATES